MRGNGLGFSGERPSNTPARREVEDVPKDDSMTARQFAVESRPRFLENTNLPDLPLCKSFADCLCCCILTTFLVASGIAIGIWYAVANS